MRESRTPVHTRRRARPFGVRDPTAQQVHVLRSHQRYRSAQCLSTSRQAVPQYEQSAGEERDSDEQLD
jgi:hypothetical protein